MPFRDLSSKNWVSGTHKPVINQQAGNTMYHAPGAICPNHGILGSDRPTLNSVVDYADEGGQCLVAR